MSKSQKCGKWCSCGRPAAWEIIETGCQVALCDKHAKTDPDFKKKPAEFAWYEIPKEQQETEYATFLRGYDKSSTDLARGVHRLRFDVIEKLYSDVATELRQQAQEHRDEGSHRLAQLLERSAVTAQKLQTQYAEMRALSLLK